MTDREEPPSGRLWWAGLILGGAFMAWGVTGFLWSAGAAERLPWVTWFVAALALHDLVFLPVVMLAGVLLRRVVPAGFRPPVLWAAATTATLLLTSYPVLTGYCRTAQAGNTTLVPRDYGRGLALVLGTVWTAALVAALVRRPRRRRRGRGRWGRARARVWSRWQQAVELVIRRSLRGHDA